MSVLSLNASLSLGGVGCIDFLYFVFGFVSVSERRPKREVQSLKKTDRRRSSPTERPDPVYAHPRYLAYLRKPFLSGCVGDLCLFFQMRSPADPRFNPHREDLGSVERGSR